jgi:hypothetical protein
MRGGQLETILLWARIGVETQRTRHKTNLKMLRGKWPRVNYRQDVTD